MCPSAPVAPRTAFGLLTRVRPAIAVATGLIAVLIGAAAARADVLDVPAGFGTIEAAVGAAADGDIVRVAAGLYPEVIDPIGKAITIESVEGPQQTTVFGAAADRVLRIVSGEGPATVIRGFTFSGGRALEGGAAYLEDSSPTLENNVFLDSNADAGGGAIYVRRGSPVFHGCEFRDNRAESNGGAIFVEASSIEIRDSSFFDNTTALDRDAFGGAVCLDVGSSAILDGNRFEDNRASRGGGGIYAACLQPVRITDSVFDGNVAAFGVTEEGPAFGGAVYLAVASDFVLDGNMVRRNRSGSFGGGVFAFGSQGLITDNRMTGNASKFGGAVAIRDGVVSMLDNLVRDNQAKDGGGLHVDGAAEQTVIANNWLVSNAAKVRGGGAYIGAVPFFTANTVAGNASVSGGGIYVHGCAPIVTNCILWGNLGDEVLGEATVSYSNVWGGADGPGNIDTNPRFADGHNGDFHLSAVSPCIDAGNEGAPGLPRRDFEGDPRPFFATKPGVKPPRWLPVSANRRVDIGADEFRWR